MVYLASFTRDKSSKDFSAFNSACHVRAAELIVSDFMAREEVSDLAGTQENELVGPPGFEPGTKGL